MKLDIESHRIGIPCPSCGQKRTETIAWFQRHLQYTCACGQSIAIDTTQLKQGIATAQKALDDFAASIAKLGKR